MSNNPIIDDDQTTDEKGTEDILVIKSPRANLSKKNKQDANENENRSNTNDTVNLGVTVPSFPEDLHQPNIVSNTHSMLSSAECQLGVNSSAQILPSGFSGYPLDVNLASLESQPFVYERKADSKDPVPAPIESAPIEPASIPVEPAPVKELVEDAKDNPRWMQIYNSAIDLIGNTNMVKLKRIPFDHALGYEVFAKLEFRNQTGSIMDRFALAIIERAEKEGMLNEDSIVNFGPDGELCLSLAHVCKLKDYKYVAHIPRSLPKLLKRQMELCSAHLVQFCDFYMTEEYRISNKLEDNWAHGLLAEITEKEIESFVTGQPDCVNIVKLLKEKGKDIIKDVVEKLSQEIFDSGVIPDIFISDKDYYGITLGISKLIKEKFPECRTIGVDSNSFCPTRVNNIFEDSDTSLEVITVDEKEAYRSTRDLMQKEGFLVGERSGAAIAAFIKATAEKDKAPSPSETTEDSKKEKEPSAIVLLTDSFYNSHRKFADDEFMISKGYIVETDHHERRWWWGIAIPNLGFKMPPIIAASETIKTICGHFSESDFDKILLWKDREDEDFPMTFTTDDVLGVASKKLLKKYQEFKEEVEEDDTDKIKIRWRPQFYCTDFGIIDSHAKMGELMEMFRKYEFVLACHEGVKEFEVGTEDQNLNYEYTEEELLFSEQCTKNNDENQNLPHPAQDVQKNAKDLGQVDNPIAQDQTINTKTNSETTGPSSPTAVPKTVLKQVMLPLACFSLDDALKWIISVEDHHRLESGWNSNRIPVASAEDLLF